MGRERINTGDQKELKRSPDIKLTGKVGSKLIGILKKRVPSKTYTGKFNSLIQVIDTDAATTLWDKEKQESVPVDIEEGDTVFLNESKVLADALSVIPIGTKIEIIYKGKGKAKTGQKAPYLYDVFKYTDGE